LIGPRFKTQAKEIVSQLATMDPEDVMRQVAKGGFEILLNNGQRVFISDELVEVVCELRYMGKAVETIQVGDLLVVIEA
jgi:hypothetical protein